MAIRLREVDGVQVALCAAKTFAEPGDVYIHDGWHYALAQKFWRDYEEVDIVDEEDIALAARLEVEDN